MKLTFSITSDSYIGMDQQLDLKLDVKEAPAIPQYSGNFFMSSIRNVLAQILISP
jgi:hypothetical protein